MIPCTSRIFLQTIEEFRHVGQNFPLTICGYEMLDKDAENLIKRLDKFIKSSPVADDTRPDKRRYYVEQFIAEYARKWDT